MLYLYVITLLALIASLCFGFDDESMEFFHFFPLNKTLAFLNGFSLGNLLNSGFVPSFLVGLGFLGTYVLGFKLLKSLEYKSKPKLLKVGDTGYCYNTINPSTPNDVMIEGEFYTAYAEESIPSFAPVIVTSTNPLTVEELYKGDF